MHFGSAKLTKNTDPNKYKYSGYGIRFDSCLEFSYTDGSTGQDIIIFRTDTRPSDHIDNKNKDILIIGEGPTQGLDGTTLTETRFTTLNILLILQNQTKVLY